MLFNDGIQTVISISSVFLAQELFVAKGLPTNEAFLVGLVLMVQFVAFFGALIFERIARVINTKNAILLSLVLWSAIVIYAYGFLETTTQAWAMGAVIAIVLGGSQALSRSLFSQMIPAGREASFFGLYEISERHVVDRAAHLRRRRRRDQLVSTGHSVAHRPLPRGHPRPGRDEYGPRDPRRGPLTLSSLFPDDLSAGG